MDFDPDRTSRPSIPQTRAFGVFPRRFKQLMERVVLQCETDLSKDVDSLTPYEQEEREQALARTRKKFEQYFRFSAPGNDMSVDELLHIAEHSSDSIHRSNALSSLENYIDTHAEEIKLIALFVFQNEASEIIRRDALTLLQRIPNLDEESLHAIARVVLESDAPEDFRLTALRVVVSSKPSAYISLARHVFADTNKACPESKSIHSLIAEEALTLIETKDDPQARVRRASFYLIAEQLSTLGDTTLLSDGFAHSDANIRAAARECLAFDSTLRHKIIFEMLGEEKSIAQLRQALRYSLVDHFGPDSPLWTRLKSRATELKSSPDEAVRMLSYAALTYLGCSPFPHEFRVSSQSSRKAFNDFLSANLPDDQKRPLITEGLIFGTIRSEQAKSLILSDISYARHCWPLLISFERNNFYTGPKELLATYHEHVSPQIFIDVTVINALAFCTGSSQLEGLIAALAEFPQMGSGVTGQVSLWLYNQDPKITRAAFSYLKTHTPTSVSECTLLAHYLIDADKENRKDAFRILSRIAISDMKLLRETYRNFGPWKQMRRGFFSKSSASGWNSSLPADKMVRNSTMYSILRRKLERIIRGVKHNKETV